MFSQGHPELVSLPCHHVLCRKAVSTGGSTTAASDATRRQIEGQYVHSELQYISPSPIRAGILYSIWQLESFLWELQPQVTGVNVKSTIRVSNTFFPFAPSQTFTPPAARPGSRQQFGIEWDTWMGLAVSLRAFARVPWPYVPYSFEYI